MLVTVVVDLGPQRWRVRSNVPTRPVAGDRLRYGRELELDVRVVVLEVGAAGALEVWTAPSLTTTTISQPELEARLSALRFRREAQEAAAA